MSKLVKQSRHNEQRLNEWQLLLLRFAITHDPIDQAAAPAAARPLDEAVPRHTQAFSYFARTTGRVCAAITSARSEDTRLTLRRFLACIDDERLKAAFVAYLDLKEEPSRAPRRAAWRDRSDLWRGLSRR